MDSLVLAAIAASAVMLLVVIVVLVHHGRLSGAVDDALERIDASSARRWWQRPAALHRGIEKLERSIATSQRDHSRLAGAVQAAASGILLVDDDGVVVFANEAAGRYLGARQGEAIAEARIREAIDDAILDRQTVESEFELYTPKRRVLRIMAMPLESGVQSLGAVAYIRDATEQRRVEAMRRDFIANASHELKTPLGALSVLAETLVGQRDDPAAAARLAARLDAEARRLSKLVEDILDLSQAEALEREQSPVDLGTVISAVLIDLEPEAAEVGVTVEARPVSPVALVWGHRRQLHTLFTNLVDNAIKYSEPASPGDRPVVTVRVSTADDQVVVDVEDEGIGIAEHHLDRIFERFYRVDKARSRETGGTGLGLSIARHIARNHRGTISVDSSLGKGSTFRVRLPLWSEP